MKAWAKKKRGGDSVTPYTQAESRPAPTSSPNDEASDNDVDVDQVDANDGASSPYPSYKEEARHLETKSTSISSARASSSSSRRRQERSSIERGRYGAVNRLATMVSQPQPSSGSTEQEKSSNPFESPSIKSAEGSYTTTPEADGGETDPSSPEVATSPYDSYGHNQPANQPAKAPATREKRNIWPNLRKRSSSAQSPQPEPADDAKKKVSWFSRGDKAPRMEDDVATLVDWLCSRPPTLTELQELYALAHACQTSEAASKAAARALRHEFKRNEHQSQQRAIRVWSFLMYHAPDLFPRQVATKRFLEVLELTVSNVKTSLRVKQSLLPIWAMYAYKVRLDHGLSSITRSYNRVRPADMPEDGLPFDEDVALPELHSTSTGSEQSFRHQDAQAAAQSSPSSSDNGRDGAARAQLPQQPQPQPQRKSFDPRTSRFITVDDVNVRRNDDHAPAREAPPPTQASHLSDDSLPNDVAETGLDSTMGRLSLAQSAPPSLSPQEREEAELAQAIERSRVDYRFDVSTSSINANQPAQILVQETVTTVSEPLDALSRRPAPPLPSVTTGNTPATPRQAEQSFVPSPDSSPYASPPAAGQAAPIGRDGQSYLNNSSNTSRAATPTQPTEKALGKRRAVSRHGSVDDDEAAGVGSGAQTTTIGAYQHLH